MSDLGRLVAPRSVALVGASTDAESISGRPLAFLQAQGYQGRLFPVNPHRAEIAGLRAYPSLLDLPETPDVALVAVKAALVPDVVHQAVQREIPFVVVLSSGFSEAATGVELTREIESLLAGSSTRLIGPNNEGLFDAETGVPLGFSPVLDPRHRPFPWRPGPHVVLSQSGGLGFGVADHLMARGLGVRAIITTGNELDLELADFIREYRQQPGIQTITLVVEGFKNPRYFLEEALEARKAGIEIVVAPIGSSPVGERAAESHTGKVTGGSAIRSAILARVGAAVVDSIEGIVDAVAALSSSPKRLATAGKRVAVVTPSGGSGIWAADRLFEHGLALPMLSPALQSELGELIPDFGSLANPVDATAQGGTVGSMAPIIEKMLRTDEIDALLVVGSYGYNRRLPRDKAMIEALAGRTIPVVIFSYTEPSAECAAVFDELRIPWFGDPDRAARGLAILLRDVPKAGAARAPGAATVPVVGPDSVTQHLRRLGLSFNHATLVQEERELEEALLPARWPVVMKMAPAKPIHKTDVGGVAVDIRSVAEARAHYGAMVSQAAALDIELRGITVERQLTGHEVMVGAINEPAIGPVVMVCAGGLDVENIREREYRLAPLSADEAAAMVRGLTEFPVWQEGSRRFPAGNIEALVEFVRVFSEGISELDPLGWAAIECNPVIVTAESAIAVDFRLVPPGSDDGPNQRTKP